MKVVTVSLNPAFDVEVVVDELIPDAKLVAVEHRRDPGGGGVNVARVLRRFSIPVAAVVAAGGSIGSELVDRLRSDDVDVIQLHQSGITRESFTVRDRATGQQYRIGVPGPPLDQPEHIVAVVLDAVAGAEIVVLSGGLPPGAPPSVYRDIVEQCPDAFTIVDASGDGLRAVVEGRPSLVKPSGRELAMLVGKESMDGADVVRAAHEVLERGHVGAIVASLGAKGAVLVRPDNDDVWFAAPKVEQISAVGAGDSMVAGIAAGLCRGEDLVAAVRRGVASGSAAVLSAGTGLCSASDTERLLPGVATIHRPQKSAPAGW